MVLFDFVWCLDFNVKHLELKALYEIGPAS